MSKPSGRYKFCDHCKRLQLAWGSHNDPQCSVCHPDLSHELVGVSLKMSNGRDHPITLDYYREGSLVMLTTPGESRLDDAPITFTEKATGLRIEHSAWGIDIVSLVVSPAKPRWPAMPATRSVTIPASTVMLIRVEG